MDPWGSLDSHQAKSISPASERSCLKNSRGGLGLEMAHQLRAHTPLPKDLGSVPRTYIWWFETPVTPDAGGPRAPAHR